MIALTAVLTTAVSAPVLVYSRDCLELQIDSCEVAEKFSKSLIENDVQKILSILTSEISSSYAVSFNQDYSTVKHVSIKNGKKGADWAISKFISEISRPKLKECYVTYFGIKPLVDLISCDFTSTADVSRLFSVTISASPQQISHLQFTVYKELAR